MDALETEKAAHGLTKEQATELKHLREETLRASGYYDEQNNHVTRTVQKSRIMHKSHALDGQGLFLCRNDVHNFASVIPPKSV